jgi:hypothetical protein
MSTLPAPFDPIYFATTSWAQRRQDWIARQGTIAPNPFLQTNADAIARTITDERTGARMVVNIGAASLLSFVKADTYQNAYEAPLGEEVRVSPSRKRVDELLELEDPAEYYFGAVSMGGTGIRFYGEYCIVLRIDNSTRHAQVLDRNSYDLIRPPLDAQNAFPVLRGQWATDLASLVTLKILPMIATSARLLTMGIAADAILHDEDFIEVHRHGTFNSADLEEVRQPPEDKSLETAIIQRHDQGTPCTPAEALWIARRQLVDETLTSTGSTARVVVSTGRGGRWD